MRVLFVGDSHGNAGFIKQIPKIAKDADVDLVIQVGDFGFWPVGGFSKVVNIAFKKAELPIWALRGNHDWPVDAHRWAKKPLDMTPGLHWVPDGHRANFDGTSLCFTGGAVSVDQDGRTEGRSWWPEEVTSEEDVAKTIESGPVDLWVTHDSVDLPPGKPVYHFGAKIDTQIAVQRHHMRLMFEALKPRLHIHGHHHHRYTAPTEFGRVYGLGFESNDALLFIEFADTVQIG